MKFLPLIFLLWGQLVFSFDESHMVECDHDHSTIEKLLEWFSSDDKRIMNAPCKSKNLPTEEEMLSYIENLDQEEGEDREIHGVKFTQEKKVILEALGNQIYELCFVNLFLTFVWFLMRS